MSMFLDNRCKYCNALLHKSAHVSKNEREKRDDAKEFCGGVCAARYKASRPDFKALSNNFLYGRMRSL